MSFGKMKSVIEVFETTLIKDAEGFTTEQDQPVLGVRAYKEEQRGNEAWKNRASFTSANALFQFRKPPSISITTKHFIMCDDIRYNIVSVEDIRNKGMYIEVLAKTITGSKG